VAAALIGRALRSLVGLCLIGLAGFGSYTVARRWRSPEPPPAAALPPASSARSEQLVALAKVVNQAARARELPRFQTHAAAPLDLVEPPSSDLDRRMLEGSPWVRLQQALTRAVSARISNRCNRGHRGESTIDIHFRAVTTPAGLVASDATLAVREGAPLPANIEECLRQALVAPLEVAPPDPRAPLQFQGDARITYVLGGRG
jgi:hypothetical protein